ncbi:MAG TPA: hypothetical protein VMV10_00245 [Pirellulales bacterium]|nr:hypothetical protein [Pirellulales bacterium]
MSPELLEHVHPDVRLRRAALADRENAYSLWAEAAAHLAPFEIAEYDEFESRACESQQDLGYWLPEGAVRAKLRDQIEHNRRALETANLGLSLGRFQWPEPRGMEYFAEDTALVDFFRPLARIRDFKARLHASCGEFGQAARELTNSLRTAELALDGDGIIVTYLVGIACHGSALASMRGLARLAGAPPAAIAQMLVTVNRGWQGAEALAQSIRTDFHYYFVKRLESLSACDRLEALVDALLKGFYSDAPISWDEQPPGPHPDGRSAWRRQRLLELLAGHPAPFDAGSTISASSHELADLVHRSDAPWRAGRERSAEERLLPEEHWPAQLSPDFPYELLGPGPEARKAVEELLELTQEDDGSLSNLADLARHWQAPDGAALATARENLRRLDNPVGRLLAQSEIGVLPNCVDLLFRTRALREATKAVLALRLYQIQRGRLPDDLESLVEVGLLAAVPADPFADRPLGYSRERAVVWSVGPDGALEGGEPPSNLVWSVSGA